MKIINLIKKLFGFLKPKKKVTPGIKFGWKPDNPDPRDRAFKVVAPRAVPPLIDLRDQCPPVYNQGNLGSCTANALGAAFQFEQKKQQDKDYFIPSRLFIYYNERAMEGTINQDAGAMIRDGIKTMVKDGVCPETMWPYKECKFTKKPSADCYKVALDNQVLQYLRIGSFTEMKQCLADGFPFVFGFSVYDSMMTDTVARTGEVPIPGANEQAVGGHAVMAVGYDDSKNAFIVRNSWGEGWGLKGYFYLPYWFAQTAGQSADYWTIRLVE